MSNGDRGPTRLAARAVSVALLVLGAVGVGCRGDGAALGGACKADGDCASGLLCHAEQCLQQGNVEAMRKAAAAPAGEGPERKVGDHLEVEWKGAWKPAVIIGVVAAGSYRVHYEGHDAEWDEVIGESRIKGGARKRRDAAVVAP